FDALTVSAAVAAILLKPHGAKRDPLEWLLRVSLGWLFWLFNRGFDAGTAAYVWSVRWLLRLSVVVLLVYGGLAFLTYQEMVRVSKGLIPQQDKGYLMLNLPLPDSAPPQRTHKVMAHLQQNARSPPPP